MLTHTSRREAVRLLRGAKGLVVSAVLTIALGVGATTAVSSVVYGVLLRPLPYAEPDSLVRIWEEHPGAQPLVRERLSDWTYHAWQASATIERRAVYGSRAYTVTATGAEIPERLSGATVSPSMFPLLGVTPALGRFFDEREAIEGGQRVVVLSDGFWRRRFAADPGAVGTTLTLDGSAHLVVGIAPAGFYFPDREAQLWTPHVMPRRTPETQRQTFVLNVVGRLRPGASIPQVEAEGTAAARSVARPPSTDLMFGYGAPVQVRAKRVADVVTARVRPAVLMMAAAVALVLLVSCANVANLLLARGIGRSRELAVRAALGASRARILRHLLAESVTLSAIGGGLGVLLAWVLVRALPAWAPAGFPRLADIQLDVRVLAFAVGTSLAAGVLSGVLPALRGARSAPGLSLRSEDVRTTTGGGERVRAALLALEAAVGVVLLVGAALLGRSFVALANVDAGYDPHNVLSARLHLTGADADAPRSGEVVDRLLERLRAIPGVVAAGAGNMAPFGQSSYLVGLQFDRSRPMLRSLSHVVTPGYAEALGLRLREGRFLQESDASAPIVHMVVNRAFAQACCNDGRPIVGRRVEGLAYGGTTEFVGVVDDVRLQGLDAATQPECYVSRNAERGFRREIYLFVRTSGDPAALAPALRALLREVSPQAALAAVGPFADRVAESVAEPRFAAAVLAAFAVLALALAATGLFGAMSYMVSRRRREIGIRAALGASRGQLLGSVLGRGLAITGAGLVAGLVAAALASRAVRPLLFGITPLDPVSFAATPVVLLVVAAIACAVPARRAAAVDPAEALRQD